jgi:hypothetical protein
LKLMMKDRVKNLPPVVTPAKAGVQKVLKRLDTGFRRYDDLPGFGKSSRVSINGPSLSEMQMTERRHG